MGYQKVDLHHVIVRTAIAPAEHVNAVFFDLGQCRRVGHPDRMAVIRAKEKAPREDAGLSRMQSSLVLRSIYAFASFR